MAEDLKLRLREYLGRRLRGVYRFSPVKREAKKMYKTCSICGSDQNIEIDHEPSLVPTDREVNSVEYFMRMFCLNQDGVVDLSRLVGLCSDCHKEKSKEHKRELAKNRLGPWSARAMEKRRRKKKNSAKRKKRKVRRKK